MRFTNGPSARPCARFLASLLLCLMPFFSSARAQDSLDPSDIWYRGFLLVQAAQELETQGKHLEALNKLTEAKPLYDHLAQRPSIPKSSSRKRLPPSTPFAPAPTSSGSSRRSTSRPKSGVRATAHRIEIQKIQIRTSDFRSALLRENLFKEGAGPVPAPFFAKCPKIGHKTVAGAKRDGA